MRAVAVFLALLVSFQCAAGYTGFIRTSGEKFVDDNCQEFVPLGMNTYVGRTQIAQHRWPTFRSLSSASYLVPSHHDLPSAFVSMHRLAQP